MENLNKKSDVLIIGGGLGGLFAGAFLVKEGYTVTILEQNRNIGGGLQCFVRKGELYETGMHILGGFKEGGNLYKICSYLGVLNKLLLADTDANCMDEILFYNTGERYCIPQGKENFIGYLSGKFPHEAENIRKYVDRMFVVASSFDLFHLNDEDERMIYSLREMGVPADEFIAEFIKDEKLRQLLAYMNPLYGGIEHHTPAYIHAIINVLYIKGSSFFKGGSSQLAFALKSVVEDAGGKVMPGEKVVKVNVENGSVTGVFTESNNSYSATTYISSICPGQLDGIITDGAFNKAFRSRINEAPTTYSAFIVYIRFKPGTFKYINHTCYYFNNYNSVWILYKYNGNSWPQGFLYLTPPNIEQGEYATHLTVNCAMDYHLVDKWKDTLSGNRGKEYNEWKVSHAEKIIDKLELIYPDIRSCIDYYFAASPLTLRDYNGVRNGALYGLAKDTENLMLSKLTIKTRIDNLFMTGQNVNLHGICGVPLTALQTAECIAGKGLIINKINNENNNK